MQDSLAPDLFLLSLKLFPCSSTSFLRSYSLEEIGNAIEASNCDTYPCVPPKRVCLGTDAHWNHVEVYANWYETGVGVGGERRRFCLWSLTGDVLRWSLWKAQTSSEDEGHRIWRNTLLGSITSCSACLLRNGILGHRLYACSYCPPHPSEPSAQLLQLTLSRFPFLSSLVSCGVLWVMTNVITLPFRLF